jgi:hypothetical protein
VERSSADDQGEQAQGGRRRDTGSPDMSVAVADPPASMSGAHWANRDSETLNRRAARTSPFRRPPAENSFPDESPVSPVSASDASGFPAPAPVSGFAASSDRSGMANADLFGPDPERFGPAGEEDTAVRKARHWTTIGTPTRRPRTSDRGEAVAPAGRSGRSAAPTGSADATAAAGPGSAAPGSAGSGSAGAGSADAGPWSSASAPGAHGGFGPAADEEHTDTIGMLGPGHDIRPHRAGRREPGAQGGGIDLTVRGTPKTGGTAPRRPPRVLWATIATVLVVLAGGVTAVVVLADRPGGLASVLRGGAGAGDQRTVTAPLDGRTEANFELVTGTTQVTLRSADLGKDLYRIISAADSGTVPRPVVDGRRVQLHLTPDGDGASGKVEIVLAAAVTWALRFTGGADEQLIDLSAGRVSGVDVIGGARRVELTLPRPSGTVGVRLTGAVDEFVVRAPQASPVRVRLDSGAKTVSAGTKTQRDVPPGSTFTPKNWQLPDRYDVLAASRVTLFSVVAVG